MRKSILPLFLLSLSLEAAVTYGPERRIAPPDYGPAYGQQEQQVVVSDGERFVAFWGDRTPGREGIYAAALDANGAVITVPSEPIVRGRAVGAPQAVWTGDAYQLIWGDAAHDAVYAARLTRERAFLAEPVLIARDNSTPIAAAANGRQTFVALRGNSGTTAVILEGDRIVRANIALPPARLPNAVAASSARGLFVFVWAETRFANWVPPVLSTVRATLIEADGTLGATVPLGERISGEVHAIGAASDGTRIGVAFGARSTSEPLVRRFTITLPVITVREHEPLAAMEGAQVQVVSTPRGFVSGHLEVRDLELSLVTAPFASATRRTISLGPAPGTGLTLTPNGSVIVAIWHDQRLLPPFSGSDAAIFGTALDAEGAQRVRDVAPVAVSVVAQRHPALAPAGEQALAVWLDLESEYVGALRATRIARDGTPLAPPVTLAATADVNVPPAAVFTGEVWLVAWVDRNPPQRVLVRRIAPDGTLLDTAPLDVGEGYWPALATNGTTTVLAMADALHTFTRDGRRAATIARDDIDSAPAIASNGSGFLVAWTVGSNFHHFPTVDLRDVVAIRLDAAGRPIDAAPIGIATGPKDAGDPRVASIGGDYVIAYEQQFEIVTKRMLASGALSEEMFVARGVAAIGLAARGEQYVLLFGGTAADAPVYAVSLDARGAPNDTPTLLTSASAAPYDAAAAGEWIAYVKTDPHPEVMNVPRVFVRGTGETRRRSVRN